MTDIAGAIERQASATSFSGVVRVDIEGETAYAGAFGMADRAHAIVNTLDTRFAMASGSKSFTALAVASLIEAGTFTFDTPARTYLGDDLPLIDDGVTIGHLMQHRSGIGDYLDEEQVASIDEYVMPIPVHRLVRTEDFLQVLDGFPMVAPPGERLVYNNGAYVVLALVAERASGVPYHDLVHTRVLEPAGMHRTAFLRSDELPGDAAIGYLYDDGLRTNAQHLPVRGNGDGGAYTTLADLAAFWAALDAELIVPWELVARMSAPTGTFSDDSSRHGMGFHVHLTSDDVVWLTGYDAGVSCLSERDRANDVTATVISNTSDGAWPMVKLVDHLLGLD